MSLISSGIRLLIIDINSGAISVIADVIFLIPSITAGISTFSSPGIYFASFEITSDMPLTSLGIVAAIRGMILSANVITLSMRLFKSVSKLLLGSAIPVMKFSHAAPIAAIEPCIVLDASFAVVPVIPISV